MIVGNSRSAPVDDRLRKVQVTTDCRPLNASVALVRVRVRCFASPEVGFFIKLVSAFFISNG